VRNQHKVKYNFHQACELRSPSLLYFGVDLKCFS
jgi:hypothetical protein